MTATSFQRGTQRKLTISRETTFGVFENNAGAQVLRRVSSTPNATRDAFRSQEILRSMQLRDARLGVKRVNWAHVAQLVPGSFTHFFEGMLQRDFAAVSMTGNQVGTLTAAAGPPGTFTKAGGTATFTVGGLKIGDVIQFAGFTAGPAANNARNYRILNLTDTVITVAGTGNEVVAAGAGSANAVSISLVGKKTQIPLTGHTFRSYCLEDWNPEASPPVADRFLGLRMQALRINVAPNGMVMMEAQMVGRDKASGDTALFGMGPPPTEPNSLNSLAGTSGLLRYNGSDIANITGLTLQLACPIEANAVVGNDRVPEIFQGPIQVEGQINCYFTDSAYADLFTTETEVDSHIYLTSDTSISSPFIAINLNRVKAMAYNRGDGPLGIIQTLNFTGLEYAGGVAQRDATTVSFQDSHAP